ncbi:MAG: hypothetical protein GC156_03775 [Actinomycetales bacterium]|nr:hypothetical protein [Actinomycetales bacterium]
MPVDRVVVITTNPAALARLAGPLSQAGLRIVDWSPRGSCTGYSRHVDEHHDLADDPAARGRQLAAIARSISPSDWVVLGTDADIHDVMDRRRADSSLTRLLPTARHHKTLGSKIAMAAALADLGVEQPAWTSASTAEAVPAAVAELGGEVAVKGDRGWGGLAVTRVPAGSAPTGLAGDAPFLVQRWEPGTLVSIDLLVVRGEVALAPYSVVLGEIRERGASYHRVYLPIPDDGLRESLRRLASGLGGTWFGNVSAIARPDGSHAIIELDPRPNAWHAYLGRLGYPLVAALRSVATGTDVPAEAALPRSGRPVVNLTRVVQGSLAGNSVRARALFYPRATWRHVHRGDLALTYREARDLARWVVLTRAGRRRVEDT